MTPDRAIPDRTNWPAVLSLLQTSFAYMEAALGHPPRVNGLIPSDLRQAATTGTAFLVKQHDQPVACLFTRPSRDFADALYLGWLAVDASCRGKGLAQALVRAAERLAQDAGYRALTLDTGTVLTDLHNVFAAMGFQAVAAKAGVTTFCKPLPADTRGHDPYRIFADDPVLPKAFTLITSVFAEHDGRISPPSSAQKMSLDALSAQSVQSEIWVLGVQPAAIVILTPKADHLYLGKLAVAPEYRGTGLAARLITHAKFRAQALGLGALELETRVELTEVHRVFRAAGFEVMAETAHPGFDRPTALRLRFTAPAGFAPVDQR